MVDVVTIPKIDLDRASPVPLARQVRAHLERLIRNGTLGPGAKLPATRELARNLAVNRTTIVLAYEDLVAGGWVRAHVGQGTFVAEGTSASMATPPPPARTPIDWSGLFSRSARIIDASEERRRALMAATGSVPGLISFAGGMPDSTLFPIEAFRRALNEVVREEGEALLQYHPVGGYPPLRRFLATYLLRVGLEASPDEILIVNGSQQGFDLLARIFVDPGDAVAIEQPTYPRAVEVFRAFGAQLVGVPWSDEGPRPDVLDRVLERHRPKLFVCQPSAHNPTGRSMSAEVRAQVLAAAARHQVPIVEDGFDGSLVYVDRPAGPLKAADRDGLVIYVGTFSKILFPGLRLGWVVAPAPVMERLRAAKQLVDLHTSALLQAAVHRFCERRLLDRHVARAAQEYRRRREILVAALRRHMLPGVTWTEPDGGFSLLLTLPPGLGATEVLPHAVERGVAFTPGRAFFLDGSGDETLRLSFSAVPADRIEEGVRRLADTIAALSRRPLRERMLAAAAVPLV